MIDPDCEPIGKNTLEQNPLAAIRSHCNSIADAVRWACVLEATAPKAGNVTPAHAFDHLCFADFVAAAEITAERVAEDFDKRTRDRTDAAWTFGRWVFESARMVRAERGTNVNLGILLLLGPLVQCDFELAEPRDRSVAAWQSRVSSVLGNVTHHDSSHLFAAIQVSQPGGMGKVQAMDVTSTDSHSATDIVSAMRLAKGRDRIAMQYADDYRDFFSNIVPVVEIAICKAGDLLGGIADAHLRLLASAPDSLIARKHGASIAELVRRLAAEVDLCDHSERRRFDGYLRGGHPDLPSRCNPGTTADLIAAALYVLLRS